MPARAVFFLLALPLLADVITTKNNKKVEGRVIKETGDELVVQTYKDGDVTIKKADLKDWKKGKTKFDDYDAKEKPTTAEGHVKLAQWCKQQGLVTLARQHFEEALKLDPKNKAAVAELYANATPIDLKIGVESDLPEKRLKDMADLFASFAEDFWFMTEGNFYIRSVTIKDKSKEGNVLIGSGDEEKQFIAGGGVSVPGVQMKVAGKCSVFTFLHESGHVFWSLPDEYKNKNGGGCPACVMIGGNMEGFGPGKWKFCDETNHTGKAKDDCWGKIKAKYKTAKHPNAGWAKDPPKPEITVTNTGQ